MEAEWTRPTPYLHKSFEQIEAACAALGYSVIGAELLAEGHANTNYKVSLAGAGDAVLRWHMQDRTAAPVERAAIARLADRVPAPQTLAFDGALGISLQAWLPGETMAALMKAGRLQEIAGAAHDIGAALGAISSVRFPQAGFLNADLVVVDTWPGAVTGLLDYATTLSDQPIVIERLGVATCKSARAVLSGPVAEALAPFDREPCLVHGDFKSSNLLIHEGHLSGVLDWEFVHSGAYFLSLAQIVRDEAHLPASFEPAFVDALSSAGVRLPKNWKVLAKAIDLVNLLDFANRESSGVDMIADIVMRMRETLRVWEHGPPVQ